MLDRIVRRLVRMARTAVAQDQDLVPILRFVNSAVSSLPRLSAGDPVGVVVQPWLGLEVPWYSTAIGIGLRRSGHRVHFIWDDMPVGFYPEADLLVNSQIQKILSRLDRGFETTRLSRVVPGSSEPGEEAEDVRWVAEANCMWTARQEYIPTEMAERHQMVLANLEASGRKIEKLVRQTRFSAIVTPGGMYRTSGLWMRRGRAAGQRVASYDSGPELLLVAVDGVAAQQADTAKAISMIEPDAAFARERAWQEFSRRRAAQPSGKGGEFPVAGNRPRVLIPLSQSFDTASIRRSPAFPSQVGWLHETVKWLLTNTDALVTVRRHPCEAEDWQRSADDYEGASKRASGGSPRVRYLDSSAAVNTYSLIEESHLVLPYTSTVGVEAAMLGKPVLASAAVFYSGLGFAETVKTRDDYFTVLERLLASEERPTEEAKERAALCYYATQCCNFVVTPFTPTPEDVARWTLRDPDELYSDLTIQDILEAIHSGVPLSVLRHRRMVGAAA